MKLAPDCADTGSSMPDSCTPAYLTRNAAVFRPGDALAQRANRLYIITAHPLLLTQKLCAMLISGCGSR